MISEAQSGETIMEINVAYSTLIAITHSNLLETLFSRAKLVQR